jgi:hypothetical protein
MLPIQFESHSRLCTFSKIGLNRIGRPSAEDMALAIKPAQHEIVIDKHTARRTVVVSDIVSSTDREGHSRSLENMKMMTVINSKDIENIWSKSNG